MTLSEQSARETILRAAQRLLVVHGYNGLSMRDLSRESGFSKGTIYHHFRDKREIFLSTLEQDLLAVQERLAEAAGGPGSAVGRVRRVIESYFDLIEQRRHSILSSLREVAGLEQEMHALMRTHREGLLRPIQAILEDGIAAGHFRQFDTEIAVIALFGVMNGFVSHRLLLADREIGPEIIEQILDLFFNGILSSTE